MAFSATEAAFEGFRLAKRTPKTILIWALAYLVYTVATLALVGGTLVTLMAASNELQGVTEPTLEAFEPLIAAYAGMMWIMPIALVFSAVIYTAAIRAVLFPADSAFGYLRLGMDEVRVFVVSLVLSILFGIVALVIFGVAGAIGGFAGQAAGDAGGLVVLVAILAAVVAFIWLALRLSLALPITVAEKKFAIFESWSLTKGHAAGLLGMTLIVIVMIIVVSILSWLVIMPILFFTGGIEQLGAMQGADLGQIVSLMGGAIAVYVVHNSILSALVLAIIMAPYAAAYRDIRGTSGAA